MIKKQKILLIKTGALGDMVLFSFSINVASRAYKNTDIYLLTSEQYAEIYKDCNLIKQIFAMPEGRNIFHLFRIAKKIRKIGFQKIFDLQGNLKTNFYTFLFHGKERIGLYRKSPGKIFLTKSIKKKSGINPVDFQKIFWDKAVEARIEGELKLWISEEKKQCFSHFLKRYGILPKNYVVFNPSASIEWETKKWIPEYWACLVEFFSKKNLPAVFIGDKNSVGINEEIIKLVKGKTINIAGKTDFFELALVIQQSKMCITTDSGPMHIGSASGTDTIAIFGPTNPRWHAAPDVRIAKSDIACSPCYKKRCTHYSCMKLITPEKIIDLIRIENQ